MPDILLRGSMLFPSVHLLLLWYTSVPGSLEWKGLTFIMYHLPKDLFAFFIHQNKDFSRDNSVRNLER